MKTYTYDDEQGTHTLTEDQIITIYWDYWEDRMRSALLHKNTAAYGKPELITRQNCIDDWITVNWAHEVEVDTCMEGC